ncbi:MAG TPA: hypothetical protein VGJ20_30580 [Xanthobacteraceae bacterium]
MCGRGTTGKRQQRRTWINLSQPGIPQAVPALATRLDARRFEHSRVGCYVTELGRVLLLRVRRCFDLCPRLTAASVAPRHPRDGVGLGTAQALLHELRMA